MIRGVKRKICKENNMIVKICCFDGRREAINIEAMIDVFKEILLFKVGFLEDLGVFIV